MAAGALIRTASAIRSAVALLAVAAAIAGEPAIPRPPNLVYVLCDDLGYGDVHALNPQRGRIATPELDRLVAEGMSFSEAHSASAVCTPSRYGILTGRYCWRTRLQHGVLWGEDKPLIAPGRLTVAGLLRRHGYATACIGKWHLGLDLPMLARPARKGAGWGIDYTGMIRNGPVAHGFDRWFGISASLDMPPFAWISDDRFTAPATTTKTFFRAGAAAADFEAVDVLGRLTAEAVAWIGARRPGEPFFLYLPLTSPHTPIVPTPEWQGRSGIGPYGDFVMQTDACIGAVRRALEAAGRADDTLFIVTSDNGCSPAAGTARLEAQGHFASADRRGYKADIWDGGHRIPFLCRWPGQVRAGARSDRPVCLNDLIATAAELVGEHLPDNAGEDSVSLLPALLERAAGSWRDAVVHHSIDGVFALRQGRWKLALGPGSGGWSAPRDAAARRQGLSPVQLYDVVADPGETVNRQADEPEVVARMTALLRRYVADGRSTPGTPQTNDVAIDLTARDRPAGDDH